MITITISELILFIIFVLLFFAFLITWGIGSLMDWFGKFKDKKRGTDNE